MSANDFLLDAATRHAIFLQRYAKGVSNDLQPIFVELLRSIEARLELEPARITATRLGVVQRDVNALMQAAFGTYETRLTEELAAFYLQELDYTDRILGAGVIVDNLVPPPAALQSVGWALRTPMRLVSGKRVLQQDAYGLLADFAIGRELQARNIIAAGYLGGSTTQEITRELTRQISSATRANSATVTRTLVNHLSDATRQAVHGANADLLDGEEWVSTLDGRTSPICRARDGETYPVDSGPRPPAHHACRSLRVPKVKAEFALAGLGGTRASADGPVSGSLTYGGWLKRQPARVQDEILGKARGALFRRGGLKIDAFVDDRGVTYALAQLRDLEPLAFERANLL